MQPSMSAFTRTPRRPKSTAIARVMPSSAARVVACRSLRGIVRSACVDVTLTIWDPLNVPVKPFGNVTVTVRPGWNPLPPTATFWLPTVPTGLAGLMELITGAAPGCTVNWKTFDCCPPGLLTRIE